jgi:hypothetical protein
MVLDRIGKGLVAVLAWAFQGQNYEEIVYDAIVIG